MQAAAPRIVNFRSREAALTGGAVVGTAPVISVVGVTSWGSADPNSPRATISSQFGQNTQYPNASYGTYGSGQHRLAAEHALHVRRPVEEPTASQGYFATEAGW